MPVPSRLAQWLRFSRAADNVGEIDAERFGGHAWRCDVLLGFYTHRLGHGRSAPPIKSQRLPNRIVWPMEGGITPQVVRGCKWYTHTLDVCDTPSEPFQVQQHVTEPPNDVKTSHNVVVFMSLSVLFFALI